MIADKHLGLTYRPDQQRDTALHRLSRNLTPGGAPKPMTKVMHLKKPTRRGPSMGQRPVRGLG